MNIFERASRNKIRFPTAKGELTVDQLWDMPLMSKNGFDLDATAISVNEKLEAISKGSFVKSEPDPRVTDGTLRLDILKHIISAKISDAAKAETRAANIEKRRKLIDALGVKENQELAEKSKKQIMDELAALDI